LVGGEDAVEGSGRRAGCLLGSVWVLAGTTAKARMGMNGEEEESDAFHTIAIHTPRFPWSEREEEAFAEQLACLVLAAGGWLSKTKF
jgi:hypothetical protein